LAIATTVRKAREGAIYAFFFFCAVLSIVTTAGIIWVLVSESIPFFQRVSIVEYLTGRHWTPQFDPPQYGVLPLAAGTFIVAFGALLVAVPIGLCTALFLSEYAAGWMRQVAKPVLEILAGIPSVVYGYFALYFITPFALRRLDPTTDVFNAASASIVVGIMAIPTIASLCDDALRAVPRTLREAGYALAGTKLEVSARVVFPSAVSGVIAACLLGLSRAVGETMAVAIAAGKMPQLTLDPRRSMQTMTAYIADICSGDTPQGSTLYYSLFAVGLTLFVITLGINLIAQRVLKRVGKGYE
jgi:phosphate transport system permease protein